MEKFLFLIVSGFFLLFGCDIEPTVYDAEIENCYYAEIDDTFAIYDIYKTSIGLIVKNTGTRPLDNVAIHVTLGFETAEDGKDILFYSSLIPRSNMSGYDFVDEAGSPYASPGLDWRLDGRIEPNEIRAVIAKETYENRLESIEVTQLVLHYESYDVYIKPYQKIFTIPAE